MTKLAIVGSRTFTDYSKLESVVKSYFADFSEPYTEYDMPRPYRFIESIISGGAKGADTLAEKFAVEHGIKFTKFLPDWNKYGKSAGPIRNKLICEAADSMIAFLGRGPGTKNAISQMLKIGKPVLIIPVGTKET